MTVADVVMFMTNTFKLFGCNLICDIRGRTKLDDLEYLQTR